MRRRKKEPTGIYIHIPFCVSRCAYCDFFSTVPDNEQVKATYGERIVEHLRSALKTVRKEDLVSLYIGGGSPSTMPLSFFDDVVVSLHTAGIIPEEIEFTVEANPADITPLFLETLRKCGVNRLSIGIQSADEAVLAVMGRRSSRALLREVLPRARESVGSLSYDIIYGFGRKPRDFAQEISWIFEQALPDHLSAYCYTRPHRRGTPPSAKEEIIEQEEEVIRSFLTAHNFVRYEVSNWARRGFESVHNRLYWQWNRYIGIGAGAHGFEPREGIRYRYPESVASFIKCSRPVVERLSRETLMREFVMLALRTVEGIPLRRFQDLFGEDLAALISPVTRERFIVPGYARLTSSRLAATEKGFAILNTLTAALFGDIERFMATHAH